MLRYLNMFVMIGIALIGISLGGFATGGKFLVEPGQAMDKMASLVYLGAGVLMIVNGVLTVKTAPIQSTAQKSPPKAEREPDPKAERDSKAQPEH